MKVDVVYFLINSASVFLANHFPLNARIENIAFMAFYTVYCSIVDNLSDTKTFG